MSLEYRHPRSLRELLSGLAGTDGPRWFLAGGTDLNVQIRRGTVDAGIVWGIAHLEELRGISLGDGRWRLGSLTTVAEILRHTGLASDLPLLRSSLEGFAAPALRSMAGIGGNIANGSPTADTVPPLLVLEAEIELRSLRGTRRMPLGEFFTGYKRNALARDEVIAAVSVPADAQRGFESFYRKVGSRSTLTIAKVAVAGLKSVEYGVIRRVRAAVGSLTEYPRRLDALERLVCGADPRRLDPGDIDAAVRSEITPISDFRSDADYRERVCLNLIHAFLGLDPSRRPDEESDEA